MTDGVRILAIPRHNPINALTMGGIVRDAGLTIEQFRRLLQEVQPNHRLQLTGAPVPSSARVLIAGGDQRNVEFGIHGPYRQQLKRGSLGGSKRGPATEQGAWV